MAAAPTANGQHWRRSRRAKHLHAALVQAGYTADDLRELVELRASVDGEPAADNAPADPAQPAVAEVLAVWPAA